MKWFWKSFVISLSLLLLLDGARGAFTSLTAQPVSSSPLQQDYPFYHTSSEIDLKLQELAKTCPEMTLTPEKLGEKKGSDVEISVVRFGVLKPPKGGAAEEEEPDALKQLGLNISMFTKGGKSPGQDLPPLRVAMIFGEHGRELITTESALHMAEQLCQVQKADKEGGYFRWLRRRISFVLIPNANPRGRQRVEQGNFCSRTNENKVDLERNFGSHFTNLSSTHDPSGMGFFEAWSSGSVAFSEPESQIVKRVLEAERPDLFVSVHSGRKGMYMPWAYTDMEIRKRPEEKKRMMQVLTLLNDRCKCEFGNAGALVKRFVTGSAMDYAYEDLKVPYAFQLEIFEGEGPDLFVDRKGPDEAFLDAEGPDDVVADDDEAEVSGKRHGELTFLQRSSSGRPSSHKKRAVSGLLQQRFKGDPDGAARYAAEQRKLIGKTCLKKFNPVIKGIFDDTVRSWSELYLDMADRVLLQRDHIAAAPKKEAQQSSVAMANK